MLESFVTDITVLKDYEELCQKTSLEILSLSKKNIEEKGSFSLVLSGGATPKGIYKMMAREPHFEWKKIHLFWGDERWVAPGHPESNYRMVKEALLDHATIPPENINPIRTEEIDPETAALFYEEDLKSFFKDEKQERNRFDLILLGVGEDGHIASLFPNSKILKEEKRWVVPTTNPSDQKRLTFTLPLINQAKTIFFLASGKKKANLIKTIIKKDENDLMLPIFKVEPCDGQIKWFLDKEAAGNLKI